ncbi:hypothetical protein NKJ09_23250 [Mesorhizobium sp. M0189]|uniref:hypothetical protein n=1 Tax=Mesorhizobium sp. M0189 TaxID=2956909 RepID=UPI00333A6A2F
MTEPYSPWQTKSVLSGTVPLAPATEAQRRVLAAIEEIEKFDTDRKFILTARARYLDISNHLTPANQDQPGASRADGGRDIVMCHSDIRTGN